MVTYNQLRIYFVTNMLQIASSWPWFEGRL